MHDAGVAVVQQLQAWAAELGFSQIGVADVDLSQAEAGLLAWLQAGFHGEMGYMAAHGLKRARPAELEPGTVRVITARMDYLPRDTASDWRARELARLHQPGETVVSVYARGRDYHKVLRSRLQQLADRLQMLVRESFGELGYRVFTDSAPVLEAELASRSGLGWRGKHTLLLHRQAGSMFFLGEIFINMPLPLTDELREPGAGRSGGSCGTCQACIDACPTGAIVAPHRLDARRCISYLTIEHPHAIPLEMRSQIGNRVYGCDDCQLVCPWNKFAQPSTLADFDPRNGLQAANLPELMAWTEQDFDSRLQGSPIRRIGYERWQRNLAVVAGNALRSAALPAATRQTVQTHLRAWLSHAGPLLREHVEWALQMV